MLSLASCAPAAYLMDLEMRYPSESGFDIYGKSVAVVYLESGQKSDTAFTYHVADGFAKKLEEDFYNGEPEVKLFKLPKHFGNYADKDTLVNLVMDTNNDVVFLIDTPAFTGASEDKSTSSYRVPFTLGLYGYDSMNKADSVYKYIGKSAFYGGKVGDKESVWDSSKDAAYMVGYNAAAKFSPAWKNESYPLLYFANETWYQPLMEALDFKWEEAREKWMALAKTKNPVKRSCAAFNVATCCYMLGQYDLALEWLNQSDEDDVLSVSKDLRKRITQRMSK